MQLLIRPDPFPDESLESYLLRLSQENGFENYQIFSGSLKDSLLRTDHEAAGAFPLKLALVNVFHANRSSGLRVRALRLIEELIGQAFLSTLHLALTHSSVTFGGGRKAVHRKGADIPLSFIRTLHIPCCPECLCEYGYIRQLWHYTPYNACHRHGGKLLFMCPACGNHLSYMHNETILHCKCGYDLRLAATIPASDDELKISYLLSGMLFKNANPLLATESLTLRFGALLWFKLRYQNNNEHEGTDVGLSDSINFFDSWPENFWNELKQVTHDALYRQIKPLNHMSLSDVFGNTLVSTQQIPVRDTRQNIILRAFLEFLTEQIMTNPRSRVANLGDLLLSCIDASILLSTSVKQIYQLQQDGFLALSFRPLGKNGISPSLPVFRLRHVIDFRLAYASVYSETYNTYLSTR